MFEIRQPLMSDDDGDTAGGGSGGGGSFFESGDLRGGRGSNIGTRDKSGFEQAASGAAAGLIGGLSGIPGAGTALKSIADASRDFNVDLATGQRIGGGRTQFDRDAPGSTVGAENREGFAQIIPGQQTVGAGGSAGGSNVASAADIAIQRALGFTDVAAEGATQRIGEARTASLEAFDPFLSAGTSALDEERAALGLAGPEAQQAFFDNFLQSPGALAAQREEEQAITRNALAIGDAGGGRVRDELVRGASGRFARTLDTRLNRLSTLSGRSQQAAFGVSGVEQGTGINLSNIIQGAGEARSSAVLGQEVAAAGARSEANRIEALRQQQQSQQDADFQSQLFGLAASAARPIISSFF